MLHDAVPLLTSVQSRRCSLKALSDSILTLSVIKVRPLAASAISQPFLLFRLFPFLAHRVANAAGRAHAMRRGVRRRHLIQLQLAPAGGRQVCAT
jgi:hypothetical protein